MIDLTLHSRDGPVANTSMASANIGTIRAGRNAAANEWLDPATLACDSAIIAL